MAEYIEREKYVKLNDIIETLEHEWGYEGMKEDLYNLPTADVVEVKHGEWDVNGINIHNNTVGNWRCSVCKCVSLKDSNYCPYCGAKMDLKEGAEECQILSQA